jgi:hypothetical protein
MCECGLIENWSSHSQMPIFKVSKGKYKLSLLNEEILLKYCFGCGYDLCNSKPKETNTTNYLIEKKVCNCSFLKELSEKNQNILIYDKELEYFMLLLKFGGQQIRYCLQCGGYLLKELETV